MLVFIFSVQRGLLLLFFVIVAIVIVQYPKYLLRTEEQKKITMTTSITAPNQFNKRKQAKDPWLNTNRLLYVGGFWTLLWGSFSFEWRWVGHIVVAIARFFSEKYSVCISLLMRSTILGGCIWVNGVAMGVFGMKANLKGMQRYLLDTWTTSYSQTFGETHLKS